MHVVHITHSPCYYEVQKFVLLAFLWYLFNKLIAIAGQKVKLIRLLPFFTEIFVIHPHGSVARHKVWLITEALERGQRLYISESEGPLYNSDEDGGLNPGDHPQRNTSWENT